MCKNSAYRIPVHIVFIVFINLMWDILIEIIEIFIEFGDGFIAFIENKNLNKQPINYVV